MKTIEQKAKQILQKYLKKDIEHTEPDDFVYVKTALQAMEDAFHDAQRWIPVEEELPINSDNEALYLVKQSTNNVILAISYRNNIFWSKSYCQIKEITHWRPIEFK